MNKINIIPAPVTVEELYQEMNETLDHPEYHITIINVLSEKYFQDCKIEASINIPAKAIADYVDDWDRTKTIVVYDAADDSDAGVEAYQTLIDMGFDDVRRLVGGLKEWHDKEYPTEGACTMDHLYK